MNTSTAKCVRLEGDLPTMAERELAAFTAAVNDLFGAEQARLAAEDWIRELGLAWEGGATVRDLRQITIQGGASLREPCQRADPPPGQSGTGAGSERTAPGCGSKLRSTKTRLSPERRTGSPLSRSPQQRRGGRKRFRRAEQNAA